MPTTYDRETLAELLEEAAAAQTAFWDALSALEAELGVELDIDNNDLENHTVDSLIAMAEGQEQDAEDEEETGEYCSVSGCFQEPQPGTTLCIAHTEEDGKES